MRVDILSKEYPPEIYGGAGVHVAELVRALRARDDVDARVHAFGGPRDEAGTASYPDLAELAGANGALRTLGVDLAIADGCAGTDLVHSHTWYANMAGHLAALLHGVPHVITAHSLEPMRPWKAEQLGGGYAVSSWVERTAYESAAAVIAVSAAMRDDVLRVLPRGRPGPGPRRAQRHRHRAAGRPSSTPTGCASQGVDPDRPSVVFVGRITRQKGLPLFLRAVAQLPPDVQIVLCAGAPDTPEIEAEVVGLVDALRADRDGVVWIREMLPRADVVALLTAATAFACPSIYEPLGIVNLEAMACETAVVATATGGIPEVVVDGETGRLVPIEQATDGTGTPLDPDQYVADFAAALIEVVSDPDRAAAMGRAGRQRAIEAFSWDGDRRADASRSTARRSRRLSRDFDPPGPRGRVAGRGGAPRDRHRPGADSDGRCGGAGLLSPGSRLMHVRSPRDEADVRRLGRRPRDRPCTTRPCTSGWPGSAYAGCRSTSTTRRSPRRCGSRRSSSRSARSSASGATASPRPGRRGPARRRHAVPG